MSTPSSRIIETCQSCGAPGLRRVLSIGYVPPVNHMVPIGVREAQRTSFPLDLVRCDACTLIQIDCEVAPEILFPPTYPYLSGTTRILRDNFANLYAEACEYLNLMDDDLALDIGSNDGTLLANFKDAGHRVLGVEPTNAGLVARERGIQTHIGFFSDALARELVRDTGRAKVITACNVFAHIPNVHGIVEGIKTLLADDGAFVCENHYLPDLLATLQYDTIYHEHLRYYALGSLERLFAAHALEVFHCHRIPTHGGSIRLFVAPKGRFAMRGSVDKIRQEEIASGVESGEALVSFAARVRQSKWDLVALLTRLRSSGARVFGLGSPSRASTLIAYAGLDEGLIECILEVSTSKKLNKYMPGTQIPVLDEQRLFDDPPEYAMLFSWHIAEELIGKLRQRGFSGKFIVPLPEPRIV